jgi:DNA-binding beta-propeller fold protein YncE
VSAAPVTTAVPGYPFAVMAARGGRWAFASLSAGSGAQIAVLALGRPPRLVRTVPLSDALGMDAAGMALTHDGRFLLVAGYDGTAVLSVAALEEGGRDAVLGVLTDSGVGQTEVALSADDQYAFVTDETTGGLSVFDLALALRRGFGAARVAVGIVPLAAGAVGVAVSPGGTRIYVTTLGTYGPHGQLWAIDAARAEHGADGTAVLARVAAGCQPVRVALSPDGSTAWVTAAQSNALLAFATADLHSDPSRALRAVVPVGSEPTGLLLVDDGRIALVGNSNRGLVPGTGGHAPQTVSVISTAAALARRPALIGAVPAGLFPRDLSYDPATGQVLLANFNSGSVEVFQVPETRRASSATRSAFTAAPAITP